MESNALFRHPAYSTLKRALIREARLQIVAAIALVIFGLVLCNLFFSRNIIWMIISLTACVCGLVLLFRAIQQLRVERCKLIILLENQPRDIVWIYSVLTQRLPFGFQLAQSVTLYFKLIDGDEISLSLPKHQLKLVSKWLNRVLPHTTFGYNKKLEQQFKLRPELLLKK